MMRRLLVNNANARGGEERDGLSQKEMEAVSGLSRSPIVYDLRLARAWVKSYLDRH